MSENLISACESHQNFNRQLWEPCIMKILTSVFYKEKDQHVKHESDPIISYYPPQVEWMSDKIMRAFEDQRNNPFQFKHVQICHSLAELSHVPDPKVSTFICLFICLFVSFYQQDYNVTEHEHAAQHTDPDRKNF